MASKSKRRRKVLGASCILAALIIAGSSFAWFTSKDEVVNRLTATADYGVSLVEDFTPPKDMVPGQEVNKDVSAVNTGSVDAFVRMQLKSDVLYTRYDKVGASATVSKINEVFSNDSGATKESTGITDGTTIANYDNSVSNFNGTDGQVPAGYPNYQYSLYSFALPTTTTLPTAEKAVTLDPRQSIDDNGVLQANEVTTLQAGGQLVVKASKSVAPNDLATRSGDDVNDQVGAVDILYYNSSDSKYIYFDTTQSKYFEVTHNTLNDTYNVTATVYTFGAGKTIQDCEVIGVQKDYSGVEQFKPADTGFYIFRRSSDTYSELPKMDNDKATYAGYYYANNTFYALDTVTGVNGHTNGSTVETSVTLKSSDNTKKAVEVDSKGVVNGLNLSFVTKDADNKNTNCTMKMELVADATKTSAKMNTLTGANYIRVTIHDNDDAAGNTDKDIILYVKLANQDKWTYVKDAGTNSEVSEIGYFYYNDELESGKTSEKLVDSVMLDKEMKKENFIDLVYDLNVLLDSVQVTRDQYNNESADGVVTGAAAGGWATPTLAWDVTPGHNTYADINAVAWKATT